MVDHWARGDYRYLVAGGVDDQPAGRWIAANWAGKVWSILETLRDYPDSFDQMIKGADYSYWYETLEPLRLRIEQEKAIEAT